MKKPKYLEEVTKCRGRRALLCVHGLNQHPSALKPLLHDLEKFGYKSFLLHLPGHRSSSLTPKSIKAQDFTNSLIEASEYLSESYTIPPLYLGYSFGGLLGALHADRVTWERMVLLAPAFRLRVYTHLLRPVLPFVDKIKSVPLLESSLERQYRYHFDGVPKEIYQSFFQLYGQFQFKDKSYLRRQRALVLSHPKDELVSYRSLARWVKDHTDWQTVTLDNSQASIQVYNHLCFDQKTLGEQAYQNLLLEIETFINN